MKDNEKLRGLVIAALNLILFIQNERSEHFKLERNKKILYDYFIHNKKISKIASEYGITGHRVSTIINTSLEMISVFSKEFKGLRDENQNLLDFRQEIIEDSFNGLDIDNKIKGKLRASKIFSVDKLLILGRKGLLVKRGFGPSTVEKIFSAIEKLS